jgi:hypothetical protein
MRTTAYLICVDRHFRLRIAGEPAKSRPVWLSLEVSGIQDQPPVLELRPSVHRYLSDVVGRTRLPGAIGALLLAALAGAGAAFAFGHGFLGWPAVVAIATSTVLLALMTASWFAAIVLGTRWTVYGDRLVMRRPVARQVTIRREDIARVRLELISGFGMQEPIYVFEGNAGRILFWTVAKRWSDGDLNHLWVELGLSPIDSIDIVQPFESMPYDRRW